MTETETGEVVNQTKKRKYEDKKVAIYGNYHKYYGYRIGRHIEVDPRLLFFKKEWFEGKDCLDIGCNQGHITIEIAKSFNCRSICGVDIDGCLIDRAKCDLERIARMKRSRSQCSNVSEPEISDREDESNSNITTSSNGEKSECLEYLLERVSFRKQNFVERVHKHLEKYDTILCLSVSKWIHLNWGDEGLLTLFVNIWRLLSPGGIFIFEPQPWKSYKSNYQVSETATYNYHNILFHPRSFQEILIDKIGFRTVESVASSLPGSATGFNRPIFVFRK